MGAPAAPGEVLVRAKKEPSLKQPEQSQTEVALSRRDLFRRYLPFLGKRAEQHEQRSAAEDTEPMSFIARALQRVTAMTRRSFLKIPVIATALAMVRCTPPPVPRKEWTTETKNAKEARETATHNIVEAHDKNNINTMSQLEDLLHEFFKETTLFEHKKIPDPNRKEGEPVKMVPESDYKTDFEKAAREYANNIVSVFETSKGELHFVANKLVTDHADLKERETFDKNIDLFIAEFQKSFMQLIKQLFVWTGAIFDKNLQEEFLEGLITKGLTKARLIEILSNDKDPNFAEMRSAVKQSAGKSFGSFVPQFMMPLALYVMSMDILPSIHEKMGGRYRANYAATIAALEGSSDNYYPPFTGTTEAKPMAATVPLRKHLEIAALIMSHPATDITPDDETTFKGLSIADKLTILGEGGDDADLEKKLQSVFDHLFDIHRVRLKALEDEFGKDSNRVIHDNLNSRYFRDPLTGEKVSAANKKSRAMLKKLEKSGGKHVLALLRTNPADAMPGTQFGRDVDALHALLKDLFMAEAHVPKAIICRPTFRHPMDRENSSDVSSVGMPIPTKLSCMTDVF